MPQTYWTKVVNRAMFLVRQHPELSGDDAYFQARREIDAELSEQPLELSPPSPERGGLMR